MAFAPASHLSAMIAGTILRATPLEAFHIRHGARMANFAGWLMPIQYRSILEEHRAVRSTAGLFDVSHMGEFDVCGPDAARFLNRMVTNDVARLYPGRVLYTPMCRPDGGVIDDLLVYMHGPNDYFLCVNAGNIASDLAWLRAHAAGLNVTITDRSAVYALLAVQGPVAARILAHLTDVNLGAIRYYHFTQGVVARVPCLISRTGYTGEDGFELYHPADAAPRLAEALLAAGRPHGLELVGLGARDSLRLEAGYPLHGHEISLDISPLTAGLGWTVKLAKAEEFIGAPAFREEKRAGSGRRVVYFRTGGRKIARAGTPVQLVAGGEAGRVLSGTLSPILNEAIGSALVPADVDLNSLAVQAYGQTDRLVIVQPPFVPLPPKP